jgi:hypothetical protein
MDQQTTAVFACYLYWETRQVTKGTVELLLQYLIHYTGIGYVAGTQHYCTVAQASFAFREIFRHDTSLDSHDNWLLEPIGRTHRDEHAQTFLDCCRSTRL